MRAGAFCDKRVIELLNRRFVSYYFNRSGKGEGGNAAASKFTTGKTKNPYAYYAAFKADGTYLGETPLYGDKDEVFAFLRQLLADHPDYAHATEAEKRIRAAAAEAPLPAARLEEELGNWEKADALYTGVDAPGAHRGRARIARYRKDWQAHAALEGRLPAPADVAMERAYRLLAAKDYAEAQSVLRAALRAPETGPRTAEMHFYCGVACWFLGQRDWAKFHWCWVQDNLPDDRMYMRCRVASAAEGMPYANPELGGFKSRGMIGTQHIVNEVARSMDVYESLKPKWAKGDFTAPAEDDDEDVSIEIGDD